MLAAILGPNVGLAQLLKQSGALGGEGGGMMLPLAANLIPGLGGDAAGGVLGAMGGGMAGQAAGQAAGMAGPGAAAAMAPGGAAGAAMGGMAGQAADAAAQPDFATRLGNLSQNPLFGMGMGMLSGNQQGDPFGGAMRGLQQANVAALGAEDRAQKEALRQALGDYFKGQQTQNGAQGGQVATTPANEATGNGMAPAATPSRAAALGADIDPMLRMMLAGQDAGNIYGGLNPFLLR